MGILEGSKVYLVGPVEVVSQNDSTEWRNDLTPKLEKMGIQVWNPLIKPEWFKRIFGTYYDNNDQINDKNIIINSINSDCCTNEYNQAMNRVKMVRDICLRLASAADFIICKIGGYTVGSYEEIGISKYKPVLFIGQIDSSWRCAQFDKCDRTFFKDNDDIISYLQMINCGNYKLDKLDWIYLTWKE